MNPKDQAAQTRVPMHLLPKIGLIEGSMACRLGAHKYGPKNWREKPIQLTGYIGAMYRHLAAFEEGEMTDKESGASHLGHIIATASIILDAQLHSTLIDDRVVPSGLVAARLDDERAAMQAGILFNEYQMWMETDKVLTEEGCWEWQGSLNGGHYGVMYINGTCHQAHRISYKINNGDIPEEHLVRHTCDNTKCVNPDHLITSLAERR